VRVLWAPKPAGWTLANTATTTARGTSTHLTARMGTGNQIALRGHIARGTKPRHKAVRVRDPASFARTLLIAALARAGIAVDANAATANPASTLPDPATVAAAPVVARVP
jgi:D-alanyl-D-alanine carboxypeptidase